MEEHLESKLNIRTSGIREWEKKGLYNRYEPTPYEHLDELFKHYSLKEGDSLVDFGVGTGRVIFYVHNRFQIPVSGMELNELTLKEALENKERYLSYYGDIGAAINIEHGYAEEYEISPEENKFFFFNPFKFPIFEKVIENILKSYEENKREIEVILYYPVYEYQKYLNKKTNFQLVDRIIIEDTFDGKDMFLIYRLEG